MQDEELAFWCFVNLMEKMGPNFSNDSSSMNLQLAALERLLQLIDPDLHAFIEAADGSNYFFCYRWLLVHFKREFTFDEVSIYLCHALTNGKMTRSGPAVSVGLDSKGKQGRMRSVSWQSV